MTTYCDISGAQLRLIGWSVATDRVLSCDSLGGIATDRVAAHVDNRQPVGIVGRAGSNCDISGVISRPIATKWVASAEDRIAMALHLIDMGLTIDQRTNNEGVPKPGELIEITDAHDLGAMDRAMVNLLYRRAHDSGRLGDITATWEVPITSLRPPKHEGTDRIRDCLARLLAVQVSVTYRDVATGKDRVLLTHLFESFDIPKDEASGGPVRYRIPVPLVTVLAQSSRWGRIRQETVYALTSKYAIALYEMIQLRRNMDRCLEHFAVDRFRDLLGVPPGLYVRGNDLVKRVVEPAVIQVNGLCDYSVAVSVERAHARAPITGVLMTWYQKDAPAMRARVQEGGQGKLGRMKRLRGGAAQPKLGASAPLP